MVTTTLPLVTYLDSIILGIIEGLTEFLPVSSTGHLILATSALGIEHTEFVKSFEIAIQLGAVFAVLALYPRSFMDLATLKKLFVAFVPTAVIGLVAYEFIKGHLIGNEMVVVCTLALGGAIMILFEYLRPPQEGSSEITYRHAVLIGIAQSFAIVPGVSRSGATVIGGLALGLSRTSIVEFSFLLAVPTMLAATGLDLLKSSHAFSAHEFALLSVGFATSFFVAVIAMRALLSFVRTRSFTVFGIYRIALAALFFFTFLY